MGSEHGSSFCDKLRSEEPQNSRKVGSGQSIPISRLSDKKSYKNGDQPTSTFCQLGVLLPQEGNRGALEVSPFL